MRLRVVSLIFMGGVFWAAPLLSQSTVKVYGIVQDMETRQPLVGAHITIDGCAQAAVSDYQGHFEIENLLHGVYTLRAGHIGYALARQDEVIVPKDRAVRVDFQLTPQAIPLEPVEVTAPRLEEIRTGQHWTISRDVIESSQAADVSELLKQVPGVDVRDEGGAGGAKTLSIRGSQTNQVLVLVDGVPLNDELGGAADLSAIPLNIIEKIEVHKGGASSRYGSGAIGGVVQIITRRTFETEIKVSGSAGSFGLMRAEPSVSFQTEKAGCFFSYRGTSSNNDFPYEYVNSSGETVGEKRMSADARSHNFYGRLRVGHRGHSASVYVQRLESDRGYPGKIDGWTPYARTRQEQSMAGADYEFGRPFLKVRVNTAWSQSKTVNRNLYPDDVALRYKRHPQYHYRYRVKNIVMAASLRYSPANWFQVSAGYSHRYLNFQNKNFRPTFDSAVQEAEDRSHGVWIHQEWKVNFPWLKGRLSVTPGLRYDHMILTGEAHDRAESQWSPSCGAQLSLGMAQMIFVKASAAGSYRMPTFADLFYQDVRVEGKPDLRPEKSRNRDAGAGFQLTWWGVLQGEFTWFHYDVEDLIVWRLGSFQVFRPFNNDAEITGREVQISAHAPRDLVNLGVSYSRLEPLNKLDNETTLNKILPYRPLHLFKGTIGITIKGFSINLHCHDIGRRYVNEANTRSIPGYRIWNADLNWSGPVGPVEIAWKLGVLNATDERYSVIRDMPLPGREWRLGLSVSY